MSAGKYGLRRNYGAFAIGAAAALFVAAPAPSLAQQSAAQAHGADVTNVVVEPGLFELAQVDGKVYVTSAGADRRDGKPGHVLALDAGTLAVKQRIESPEKPFALVVNRTTGKLYVGHTMSRSVSVYDLATLQRTGLIALQGENKEGKPFRGRQLLVDEGTDTLYVGSPAEDGPVWVIDGATATIRARIDGVGGPGLAFDPERQRLYTSGKGFFSVIDTGSNRLVRRHAVTDKQDRFLVNIEVDPAQQRLLATESKHGEVLVLDPDSGNIRKIIPTGKGALAIRRNADGSAFFVTNRGEGTLSVIDGASLTVRQTVPVSPYPNSIAYGADASEILISIKQPRDASVAGYREDRKESVARIRF